MGERDELKNGLRAQFAFLTSEFGFRGPDVTDLSLLLTLLYRSTGFNLEITAELRDWFLDFHVLPPAPQRAADGFRKRRRSYDLIGPGSSEAEKALFEKVVKATAPRGHRNSVPAMLEAGKHLAALLRLLLPRLQACPDGLFTVPPNSA